MTVKNPAPAQKHHALKDTRGDKIFYVVNAVILTLLALIVLYPLYFIVIASISDPDAVLGGQVVLYPVNILIASESTVGGSGETILQQYRLANQLKYVSVIVSSLPVLCLYPFVQKYFAQGVMIGSLKG